MDKWQLRERRVKEKEAAHSQTHGALARLKKSKANAKTDLCFFQFKGPHRFCNRGSERWFGCIGDR
ncbi:hypothetical protein GBA52_019601, partial [Prunus armeniaca]